MKSQLSPGLRRALALAILLAVVAAGWTLLCRPVIDLWWDLSQSIDDEAELLKRYRAVAAQRGEIEGKLKALAAKPDDAATFWTGQTASVAAAAIQARARQIILSAGGTIRSAQELSATAEHAFTRLGVGFDLDGDTETLQQVLLQLEATSPKLYIDSLEVMAPESQSAEDHAAKPPRFSIRFELFGYLAGAAP
jgi:general secretion pathway protein M